MSKKEKQAVKQTGWKKIEYWTISLGTEAFLTAFALKGLLDSLSGNQTLGVVISYTLVGVMLYLQLRVKLDK